MYNQNSIVRYNINYSYGKSRRCYFWGPSWFLAQGLSSHNTGAAIDVTLCNNATKKECNMPTDMHELSTKAIKYYSRNCDPNPSNYSKEMTEDAKRLDRYMTNVGMTTLASEWWHFQEQDGYKRIRNATNLNGCDFQVEGIVNNDDMESKLDFNNDGKVDSSDAQIVLRAYARAASGNEKADLKYDVNGDGRVDMRDATFILSYYAKKATNQN